MARCLLDDLVVRWWFRRTHRACAPSVAVMWDLRCLVRHSGLGGDAPENHGSGVLDGFQALAQEISIPVPKLDVVLGRGSGLEADCLTNHKGHCFGFGFADLLGGQRPAVASMQHFVADFM